MILRWMLSGIIWIFACFCVLSGKGQWSQQTVQHTRRAAAKRSKVETTTKERSPENRKGVKDSPGAMGGWPWEILCHRRHTLPGHNHQAMGRERPAERKGKDQKSESVIDDPIIIADFIKKQCSQQKVKEETTVMEMTYGSKPNTPRKILKSVPPLKHLIVIHFFTSVQAHSGISIGCYCPHKGTQSLSISARSFNHCKSTSSFNKNKKDSNKGKCYL